MKLRARTLLGVVLLAGLAAALARGGGPGPAPAQDGAAAIEAAFQERTSALWVEAAGTVERLLPDDREGSRHQRFILRLPGGHTLLVSHNVDLAPRVAGLERGASVRFRGRYEWNDQGGVIHWTHHDPDGRIDGGWIEVNGQTFR